MAKSKVNMPSELKKKCKVAIHSAATAAGAGGAIPIPISDTIPITAAQIGMIIAIGKVFDITLTQAAAKSIMGITLAQGAGRAIVSNVLKAIPGAGTVLGAVIGAATAVVLTETLGWIVADDFYRMYKGEEPHDIAENAANLKTLFEGARISKN